MPSKKAPKPPWPYPAGLNANGPQTQHQRVVAAHYDTMRIRQHVRDNRNIRIPKEILGYITYMEGLLRDLVDNPYGGDLRADVAEIHQQAKNQQQCYDEIANLITRTKDIMNIHPEVEQEEQRPGVEDWLETLPPEEAPPPAPEGGGEKAKKKKKNKGKGKGKGRQGPS